jgi:predicted transcriptional regulator
MSEIDPVLTAEEIAEELQQSKATVYRLMRGLVKGVSSF